MVLTKIKDKIKTYGEVVMFSHTLFSLPFAVIAMVWASKGLPDLATIFWILVCLIAARNGANAFNRIADRKFDSKNPRLQERHFVRGVVSVKEITIFVIVNYAVFIFAAYMLNPLAFVLSPLAVLVITMYSYTKRFTWLCHVWLGLSIAIAPIGAWIAVTGSVSLPPVILGLISTLWVAGFDIIYATQDIDFDRGEKLYSIPAKFGLMGSLYIARGFHLIVIGLFVFLFFNMNLGFLYLAGVIISAALLILEHKIVSPKNVKIMNIAYVNINQVVSMTILVFTLLDFIVRKGF